MELIRGKHNRKIPSRATPCHHEKASGYIKSLLDVLIIYNLAMPLLLFLTAYRKFLHTGTRQTKRIFNP
jgi:hypothetical protein